MVCVHGLNGYDCPDRIAVDMAKLDKHFFDIAYLDTLSAQQTPIHQLDPRARLITSLVFITTAVSFGKYNISALLPYFVYPVFLIAMGNVPPGYLLKKITAGISFCRDDRYLQSAD
jgi:cobalt/nickel transport system permease protein